MCVGAGRAFKVSLTGAQWAPSLTNSNCTPSKVTGVMNLEVIPVYKCGAVCALF